MSEPCSVQNKVNQTLHGYLYWSTQWHPAHPLRSTSAMISTSVAPSPAQASGGMVSSCWRVPPYTAGCWYKSEDKRDIILLLIIQQKQKESLSWGLLGPYSRHFPNTTSDQHMGVTRTAIILTSIQQGVTSTTSYGWGHGPNLHKGLPIMYCLPSISYTGWYVENREWGSILNSLPEQNIIFARR